YEGIDNGYFQGEIAEAAYQLERKINSGRRVVVGVNRFTETDDGPLDVLKIGAEVEERQLKRLAHVKAERDDAAVRAALDVVAADAGRPDANLMPPILDAVRVYATVAEIIDTLADVFGRWREDPVI
ncbi:MAG: methylmalonyl-CoA mutase family protein, partial [Acidimicrobiales bacterium]|nr:methylmalonyl-CoA mutase family protein [Acidimicrobiales bacterium]